MKNLNIKQKSPSSLCPAIFELSGALCGMDAIEFKKRLLIYLEEFPNDVALDLCGLNDIDLAGINVLAMAYKKMKQYGCQLEVIISAQTNVLHMLSLTKMDRFLPIQMRAAA